MKTPKVDWKKSLTEHIKQPPKRLRKSTIAILKACDHKCIECGKKLTPKNYPSKPFFIYTCNACVKKGFKEFKKLVEQKEEDKAHLAKYERLRYEKEDSTDLRGIPMSHRYDLFRSCIPRLWTRWQIFIYGRCKGCGIEPRAPISSSYCDGCIDIMMKEEAGHYNAKPMMEVMSEQAETPLKKDTRKMCEEKGLKFVDWSTLAPHQKRKLMKDCNYKIFIWNDIKIKLPKNPKGLPKVKR